MRVLVTLTPEKSFFNYQVPLAWALRTAGHDVRIASQPALANVITQAGLTAVPVGKDRDYWRVTETKPGLLASMRSGITPPYDAFDDPTRATWDYLQRGTTDAVNGWHRLTNFPLITDLVEFARQWRPDLVLWEPLNFAGAIAAKACGAAHARMLWGTDVYGITRERYLHHKARHHRSDDPLGDWLGSYAREYGFEYTEDMCTGQVTIDQLPSSLTSRAVHLRYLSMQYIPYGGPATVPDWLRATPKHPRIALTLGLTATETFGGYTIAIPDILSALAELDVEVIATLAEQEQRKLAHIPPNVRIVAYAPLHALVPTCSAVINHAGAATLLTVARQPIPQLALPYHFDQPVLARKLAAFGAGLHIPQGEATGDGVLAAVRRLLDESTFRHRAAALRDEIRAMATPNELVGRLEEFVAEHRDSSD